MIDTRQLKYLPTTSINEIDGFYYIQDIIFLHCKNLQNDRNNKNFF